MFLQHAEIVTLVPVEMGAPAEAGKHHRAAKVFRTRLGPPLHQLLEFGCGGRGVPYVESQDHPGVNVGRHGKGAGRRLDPDQVSDEIVC